MIHFRENVWTDGRTDGRTVFHRALSTGNYYYTYCFTVAPMGMSMVSVGIMYFSEMT